MLEIRKSAVPICLSKLIPRQREVTAHNRSSGNARYALRSRQKTELVHARQRAGMKQHRPKPTTRQRDPNAPFKFASVPLERRGILNDFGGGTRVNLIDHVASP